ncbi:MAG: alpha/beta hydrolase, partial [Bacteroidia bacterium]|nr:alpha/beta hydrolase [Bacteroidia bacterium]MDW8334778.1 alpha/beta hydrolase [Bacteroidia bacterium]
MSRSKTIKSFSTKKSGLLVQYAAGPPGEELPFFRTFHDDQTERPPILMVHGYMVNGAMYDWLLDTPLNEYRWIVPDLRGFGKSLHLPRPYTIARFAEDLVRILDELKVEKTHLLGYSMGGLVSQLLTLNYADRVETLTLACTFAFKPQTPLERLQGLWIRPVIQRIGVRGIPLLLNEYLAQMLGRVDVKTLDLVKKMLYENREEVILEAATEIFKFDSRERLKDINVPTLVVGAMDDILTPIYHTHMLAGGIPGAKIKVFENAGHGLINTHAAEFARVVHRFLRDCERKRSV